MLKNSNCDNPQNVPKIYSNCDNSKTRVIKLKNSNCDKSQKLKLWKCLKTQIMINLKNSNWHKTKKNHCYKTQNLQLWQNKKIKLIFWQNLNCDKTHKLKLWQNSKSSYGDTLTTDEMFLGQLSRFSQCFLVKPRLEFLGFVIIWVLNFGFFHHLSFVTILVFFSCQN